MRYLARSRNPTGIEWIEKLNSKKKEKDVSPCRPHSTIAVASLSKDDLDSQEAMSPSENPPCSDGQMETIRELDQVVDDDTVSGSDHSVVVNFRELLWYWTEYYLRRGRDRLSLEFSSHVPFRHWKMVVGKLS